MEAVRGMVRIFSGIAQCEEKFHLSLLKLKGLRDQ